MESIAEGTAATEASAVVETVETEVEETEATVEEDQYQDDIEEEDLEVQVQLLRQQIAAELERYDTTIKYYQDRMARETAHHTEV